jgi:hypothetical protein
MDPSDLVKDYKIDSIISKTEKETFCPIYLPGDVKNT